MPHNNEASVEEILESIKKVIARDNREIPPAVQIPDEGGAIAREDDDILDLGEMEVAEDNDPSETPLTTDEVQKSMRENFEALAMLAEPGARPQIVRSGETSLEGLVREMLRPMLADWLDTNLPGMVEKMVQAEIARIAGKRG
jgi:cell pole-organizing protein PopZ